MVDEMRAEREKKTQNEERKVKKRLVYKIGFLILFNLFFFTLLYLIRNGGTLSEWISYGFVMLAWLLSLYNTNPSQTIDLLERHYGYTSNQILSYTIKIAVYNIYFIVEVILGTMFIILNPTNFMTPLIVQVGLLFIVQIVLIVEKSISKNKDNAAGITRKSR